MELFLTLKLYIRKTEFFEIKLFLLLNVSKQNICLYKNELVELELFD